VENKSYNSSYNSYTGVKEDNEIDNLSDQILNDDDKYQEDEIITKGDGNGEEKNQKSIVNWNKYNLSNQQPHHASKLNSINKN